MKNTDTCNIKCKFWKKYKETCPFYIETTWVPVEGGQSIILKDCAPKRSVLLQIETSGQLLGLQRAAESERNYQHGVLKVIGKYINSNVPIPKISCENVEVLEIETVEDND